MTKTPKNRKWLIRNGRPFASSNKSRPRASKFDLSIWRGKKLAVSFRRFYLKPANRSLKQRQTIISLHGLFGYKQLAITWPGAKTKNRFRYKTLAYLMLVVVGLGGVGYFGVEVFGTKTLEPISSYSPPVPEIIETETETEPQYLKRSKPVNVVIPKIGVDAGVETVGQRDDGTMETPSIWSDVTGWYKHGPTPGEQGPAIVVGHVDTINGPSVFWRLRELAPGDSIKVERADGQEVEFVVDTVKQFKQSNFPTKQVYGNIEYAGLRLITCGGQYSAATDSYSHNTVVFASAVN